MNTPPHHNFLFPTEIQKQVIQLLNNNEKVNAIKYVRDEMNISLREAMNYVNAVQRYTTPTPRNNVQYRTPPRKDRYLTYAQLYGSYHVIRYTPGHGWYPDPLMKAHNEAITHWMPIPDPPPPTTPEPKDIPQTPDRGVDTTQAGPQSID